MGFQFTKSHVTAGGHVEASTWARVIFLSIDEHAALLLKSCDLEPSSYYKAW